MTWAGPKDPSLGPNSPWSKARESTCQPTSGLPERQDALQQLKGEDHIVTHRHRLSLRSYPEDCPPLKVRWFYAVDSPKRKPTLPDHEKKNVKPLPLPKKFVPFSTKDSQSIEGAFQKLCEVEAEREQTQYENPTTRVQSDPVKVPVNEDYLFDVDVEERELGPAYWEGPVYEVRRGSWFFQDGSTLKPCSETLATQLEEGYLKMRPWRFDEFHQSSNRVPADSTHRGNNKSSMKRDSKPDMKSTEPNSFQGRAEKHGHIASNGAPSYRLFGAYMNSIVTYQDSSTALLANDDFMSRVSTTVYQTLGGVAGTKVVRGFTETKKQKENPDLRGSSDRKQFQDSSSSEPERIASNFQSKREVDALHLSHEAPQHEGIRETSPRSALERQMSSLAGEPQNAAELEEQARKQEEKEMEDSREVENEDRERTIDHLILVTHGIGQRLGLRLESINFIHDVNVLRKTMKSVYKASPDLQALNSAFSDNDKNCRIQVLPVCWRHLLDFPYRGVRQNRREFDLADAGASEDDIYPSLNDITLDSVPAVRNLISDLAMDVLLYQSAYCEHITDIVQQECNRIVRLFKQRNPSFNGSVSLCGHSLGSAILFDILCHQQDELKTSERKNTGIHKRSTANPRQDYPLEFDCEELFCLGSPLALFQMLKGNTIAGREKQDTKRLEKPPNVGNTPDTIGPSGSIPVHSSAGGQSSDRSTIVSSPKCRQLYNIFHPSDPVSYRIEPLISPDMSTLKPQPLPSIKKSLWTASGQSLSNIGSRVGQSVGSLWSNFTSGVASSLLNRSLGLTSDELPASASNDVDQSRQVQSLAGDSNPDANAGFLREYRSQPRTLIETDLETLYDGFEKSRGNRKEASSQSSAVDETAGYPGAQERARQLKLEDAKVRALNANGRVDYSVQEGAFDISLIASIASHLTYWADEDVNHFILSQIATRSNQYYEYIIMAPLLLALHTLLFFFQRPNTATNNSIRFTEKLQEIQVHP